MSAARAVLSAVSALGVANVLVGCGGDDDSQPNGADGTTTTTTQRPVVPWSAECSAHEGCGSSGLCCPASNGEFDACCGQVDSNASLAKFVGVGYTTVPAKDRTSPVCDDFMAEWSEPIWGPSVRDDLRTIKDMGFDAVRTYGIGSHLDHAGFLDRAAELGLKVLPGFADYPYLRLGSSCNVKKVQGLNDTDCIRRNGHECHDVIKAHYLEMLKNGYTYLDEHGDRRYHDALHTITVINECELKLEYNNGEVRGRDGNHAKVIVSATDGLLSAEDELGIVGPRPALTATASLATCPDCKSTRLHFPGIDETTPTLPFIADMFLGFQDPEAFLGYSPKHDLLHMYQTRWVNSFNTPRPAESLCAAENKILKVYKQGPLSQVPVYIGEFHSNTEHAQEFKRDIEMLLGMMNGSDDACGSGDRNLAGVNLFEFQKSYWKGDFSEGGTGTKYGIWALGDESMGKTRADINSIGEDEFDIYCLFPVKYEGHEATPGDNDTLPNAVIDALGGRWPEQSICSAYAPHTLIV